MIEWCYTPLRFFGFLLLDFAVDFPPFPIFDLIVLHMKSSGTGTACLPLPFPVDLPLLLELLFVDFLLFGFVFGILIVPGGHVCCIVGGIVGTVKDRVGDEDGATATVGLLFVGRLVTGC